MARVKVRKRVNPKLETDLVLLSFAWHSTLTDRNLFEETTGANRIRSLPGRAVACHADPVRSDIFSQRDSCTSLDSHEEVTILH